MQGASEGEEGEEEEEEEVVIMARREDPASPTAHTLENVPLDYQDYLDDDEIAAFEAGDGGVGAGEEGEGEGLLSRDM